MVDRAQNRTGRGEVRRTRRARACFPYNEARRVFRAAACYAAPFAPSSLPQRVLRHRAREENSEKYCPFRARSPPRCCRRAVPRCCGRWAAPARCRPCRGCRTSPPAGSARRSTPAWPRGCRAPARAGRPPPPPRAPHGAAPRRVLCRVRHQVGEHLRDAVGARVHRHVGEVGHQQEVGLLQQGAHGVDGVVRDLANREGAPLDLQLAAGHLLQVQHVVDQPPQPLGIRQRPVQPCARRARGSSPAPHRAAAPAIRGWR